MKRITEDVVKKRLAAFDIELLTLYTIAHEKHTVRHNCGYTWSTSLSTLQYKGGCKSCSGRIPYNLSLCEDRLKELGTGILIKSGGSNAFGKSVFICPNGHTWEAITSNVVTGKNGCPHCSGRAPLTLESINERLRESHLIVISRDGLNCTYNCSKGHTGTALIDNILVRKSCPMCNKRTLMTEQVVLSRLRALNYILKTPYTGCNNIHTIGCKVCGYEFNAKIHRLFMSRSCRNCSNKNLMTEERVVELLKRNGLKLDQPFTGAKDYHKLICDKGHTIKSYINNNLYKSVGCPVCNPHGFNPSSPAIMYYLEVTGNSNEKLYKIGVTNRSVKERFLASDLMKIKVLRELTFESGQDAYDLEQYYLKLFNHEQYLGEQVLSSGNTELFNIDIFNLN